MSGMREIRKLLTEEQQNGVTLRQFMALSDAQDVVMREIDSVTNFISNPHRRKLSPQMRRSSQMKLRSLISGIISGDQTPTGRTPVATGFSQASFSMKSNKDLKNVSASAQVSQASN